MQKCSNTEPLAKAKNLSIFPKQFYQLKDILGGFIFGAWLEILQVYTKEKILQILLICVILPNKNA